MINPPTKNTAKKSRIAADTTFQVGGTFAESDMDNPPNFI
jgi:hypothetical protein